MNFPASLSYTDLTGTMGFNMTSSGRSVSLGGDINGDGKVDLLVGAANAAYVMFGLRKV